MKTKIKTSRVKSWTSIKLIKAVQQNTNLSEAALVVLMNRYSKTLSQCKIKIASRLIPQVPMYEMEDAKSGSLVLFLEAIRYINLDTNPILNSRLREILKRYTNSYIHATLTVVMSKTQSKQYARSMA